jgi:drug/metabolite transporter (DMT)-like permease
VARTPETIALTLLALVAFAANSILTRMALAGHLVDAASFTTIRLASGAVVLAALVGARARGLRPLRGRGALGPLALFAYAAPFSFAYLRIGAAVGALVLGYLVLPAATRPDPLGTLLMILAGAAWGVYSLVGKKAGEPLAANARSFLWATALAILLCAARAATGGAVAVSTRGATLAVVSGAVTSALGYAIWYRALRGLTATQAAIVQLSVPVIAGLGAVALLGEHPSGRLIVSALAVLGGLALVLSRRR